MSEHLLTWLQYWLKDRRDSTNSAFAGLPLVMNTLRYTLLRKGVLATGSSDLAAFVRLGRNSTAQTRRSTVDSYSLDLDSPTMSFDTAAGHAVLRLPAASREPRHGHGAILES